MAPCELFEETKINYGKHRRSTIFASCDFCFVYFLNQEQVRFFKYLNTNNIKSLLENYAHLDK